ncbi:menaquinone reductase molybdopterin-binding-like subunit QrcB [uncultured Desulfosarcina sp.]|uniref:menaquinone reductase molybdopterin-binding-like subunit QrcB n=1 Tax=uncultured Desulfosarcina sp. TaxID=218289 RepID=UPI0029C864D4|nr:menaquinone reductase molybdopterin-binding-like subunit QrcB [uncultured Desulfosarcina sp.]
MKVDRRSFLSFVIGGAAGTALSPLPWKLMDDSSIWSQMWPWTPVPPDGEVVYEDSTCTLCPGGCGISVRKVDNRAVKIEGKPGHPVNDGGICILGLSGLQLLYGPTRIKSPMKRIGERGQGKWQKISWDEAMAILAEKLSDIRNKGEAHTVAAIAGTNGGTVPALLQRFLAAYGSPNFIHTPSHRDADELAVKTLFGASGRTGFDLENADYILSFGSGIVDGWGSPVRMFRASSLWKEKDVTVVQIEPRLSNSAAKATRWIPINPGTEADLALGIAAVMVSKNRVDTGTVSGAGGWENQLLANYGTQKVSQITGVDANVIVDLAKGFASANRPLALCGRGKGLAAESLRETAAVYALNALAGNINREGGMWALPEADYIRWPEVASDELAAAGLAQPRVDGAGTGRYANARHLLNRLADSVNGGGPYPLQALLVAGANPCYDLPDTRNVRTALGRIPFIVSFSSFSDETAAMADLLLPDHIYLERYTDVPVDAGLAWQVIGLSKPVVSPQFNTRHLGETLIMTAKAMGGSMADAFPWDDYETCLEETLAEKWDVLMEEGVWVETDIVPVADTVRLAGMDAPAVQAEGDGNSFPLMLIPYDSIRLSSGYIGDPPFMIKTVANTVIKGKDGFVEINPRTAAAAGLSEGSMAKLTTPRGEARVRIHLFEGIQPGVIAMARGLGHTAYDGYLAGKGVNVNELIGPVEDPSSGHDAAWGIRAKLAKA